MSAGAEDIRASRLRVEPEQLSDPQFLAGLFGRLRGRLTFWISVRLGRALRARVSEEDVLQETFIEAYRSLSRFEDQGEGSFYFWLLAIAENRIRDMSKRHSAQKRNAAREVALAGDSRGDAGPIGRLVAAVTSPAGRAHRTEMARRLASCLDRIPEQLREIVVLHAIEGQTFKAIGKLLHRRPQTVSALYIEALERLRDELGPGLSY